jgi:hypothetical protein
LVLRASFVQVGSALDNLTMAAAVVDLKVDPNDWRLVHVSHSDFLSLQPDKAISRFIVWINMLGSKNTYVRYKQKHG